MAGKKGSTSYSAEIKIRAVRMFLEEGKSRREIVKILGLRKAERITKWVGIYRREGELGLQKAKGRPQKVEDKDAYIARLEMENELLKKFQAELRKLTNKKPGTE